MSPVVLLRTPLPSLQGSALADWDFFVAPPPPRFCPSCALDLYRNPSTRILEAVRLERPPVIRPTLLGYALDVRCDCGTETALLLDLLQTP